MNRFAVMHINDPDQTEVTRRIVTSFFTAQIAGDHEAVSKVASPDMTVWVLGDFWWSGMHDLADMAVIRDAWVGGLKDGGADFSVELLSVLADGNRASVETRITATWADGRPYESLCHLALDVADGKVVGYREYFDTAYEATFRQAERPINT